MRKKLKFNEKLTIGKDRTIKLVGMGQTYVLLEVEAEEHVRVVKQVPIGDTDELTTK